MSPPPQPVAVTPPAAQPVPQSVPVSVGQHPAITLHVPHSVTSLTLRATSHPDLTLYITRPSTPAPSTFADRHVYVPSIPLTGVSRGTMDSAAPENAQNAQDALSSLENARTSLANLQAASNTSTTSTTTSVDSEPNGSLGSLRERQVRTLEAHQGLISAQREMLRAAERTIQLLQEQIRLYEVRARFASRIANVNAATGDRLNSGSNTGSPNTAEGTTTLNSNPPSRHFQNAQTSIDSRIRAVSSQLSQYLNISPSTHETRSPGIPLPSVFESPSSSIAQTNSISSSATDNSKHDKKCEDVDKREDDDGDEMWIEEWDKEGDLKILQRWLEDRRTGKRTRDGDVVKESKRSVHSFHVER